MSAQSLADLLTQQFPQLEFKREHRLAAYTTVKIGGPAEVFCETRSQHDFVSLISYARQQKIPVTVLGWGANTLIADRGIRGLVVKNLSQDIKILGETPREKNDVSVVKIQHRHDADQAHSSSMYTFTDLDIDESSHPRVRVRMDAGVAIPYAMNHLYQHGITGLQWYARIPATVAGAIVNNIHGGTHFIAEVLESVTVITSSGLEQTYKTAELEMGYDDSRFHRSDDIIISADFLLYKGDVEQARAISIEWARRKSVQPARSLGCIFQNITQEERERLGFPTTSVGYIVEHILGMKGYQVGDAKVSEKHCAFIENIGNATATEYLNIIREIIEKTREKTGLTLEPEIFFKGFTAEELKSVSSQSVHSQPHTRKQ